MAAICFSSASPAVGAAEAAPPTLIRLHVLANSESLEDQQAKIAVRDELLAALSPWLQGACGQDEATGIIKAHLSELTEVAAECLRRQGQAYGASLQFGLFNFPDKHYGAFTLPAGRYQALNVTLGSGSGRNWWCVIFPPMCLTAGVCQPEAQPEANTYVIRSCVLEWWSSFWGWVTQRS